MKSVNLIDFLHVDRQTEEENVLTDQKWSGMLKNAHNCMRNSEITQELQFNGKQYKCETKWKKKSYHPVLVHSLHRKSSCPITLQELLIRQEFGRNHCSSFCLCIQGDTQAQCTLYFVIRSVKIAWLSYESKSY